MEISVKVLPPPLSIIAALTSNRSYRKAFDADTAVELMIDEVKNFDMKIFLAFLEVIHADDWETIMREEQEEVGTEEIL